MFFIFLEPSKLYFYFYFLFFAHLTIFFYSILFSSPNTLLEMSNTDWKNIHQFTSDFEKNNVSNAPNNVFLFPKTKNILNFRYKRHQVHIQIHSSFNNITPTQHTHLNFVIVFPETPKTKNLIFSNGRGTPINTRPHFLSSTSHFHGKTVVTFIH